MSIEFMRIKDIPKTCPVVNTKCSTAGVERPREKLIQKGPENLKDKELLAIFIKW